MRLEFTQRSVYGNVLFYPTNDAATAIVNVTGRKCFKVAELIELRKVAAFQVVVNHGKDTKI